jgi:hypothetical protein
MKSIQKAVHPVKTPIKKYAIHLIIQNVFGSALLTKISVFIISKLITANAKNRKTSHHKTW